jgi:hypothetical protein
MMIGAVCNHHPEVEAAWLCSACARNLCEECAVAIEAGRGVIAACPECGRAASPVLVQRAVFAPFRTQVRRALGQALAPRALALAALVSCASETLRWVGKDGWVAGNALVLGWALLCCRLAASGLPPFTRPTSAELAGALTAPVVRLAISFGVVAAAAFWAVDGGYRSSPWHLALLLAAATIWLLPPAFVDAAIEAPEHRWLGPWSLPAFEGRVRKDIRPIRIMVAVLVAFAMPQALLAPLDFRLDTNLFTHIAQAGSLRFGAVVALAGLASLTGTLVFTRAQEFGHGDPAKYLVAASPDACPRGRRASTKLSGREG